MTKPLRTKRSKPSYMRQHSRLAAVIGFFALAALWLLGAPQHSYYFVRCGGDMPVRYTTDPFPKFGFGGIADVGYFIPSDTFYYDTPYLWASMFYCTEQQAIGAGLSPGPLSDVMQHLPNPSVYRKES